MFKVQSLKRVIVMQFTVILVPLVCLLVFQSLRNQSRSEELNRLFGWHELALGSSRQFATFVNGAADAVDTGTLTPSALAALPRSAELLKQLGEQAGAAALVKTANDMTEMAATLATQPGLAGLQALQSRINTDRDMILGAQVDYGKRMDASIARSIDDVAREAEVVGVLSLLLLGVTIWFVARMIRDLSKPLGLAVSVANRIAEGREVASHEFQGQRDIGNLLHSLEGMHGHLNRYRDEVEATRRSLENNVQQLLESGQSLAEAQRQAQLGNWHWDLGSPSAYWSEQMYRVLGSAPGECEPALATVTGLMNPRQRQMHDERLPALLKEAGSFSDEIHIRGFDGADRILHHQVSSITNADGAVLRLCGTLQDITTRRQAEEEIRRLAHFDSLTGLPNRQHFLDQLEHAVARAKREGELLATMFLDLDRFKRVNDTLGHAAGDALLKEASRRLSACVREGDYLSRDASPGDGAAGSGEFVNTVARLAGDEFTTTLVALKRPQDAARIALRILDALAQPFQIDGQEVSVTASIGISLYPTDGDSAELLLKNADTAMYRAKEIGKNTYQFFAEDMNTSALEKLALENDLRMALERDQFVLYYQPKIEASTGTITGVEALIRWAHPQWGLMAPGRFIPLAEETGLITKIGYWVLDTSCRQLRQWRDAGLPPLSIAINLASPSFKQPDLVQRVQAALHSHGVAPHLLQLEATESMMMKDAEITMRTLGELR